MTLEKRHVWEVAGQVFATEAEADAYLDREQRIKRAAALLADLNKALGTDMAKRDPKLANRMRSSATALADSFRPELIARAFALCPEILADLQAALRGDTK